MTSSGTRQGNRTAAQQPYLQTLPREAGAEAPESMTKADAATRMEELQEQAGRAQ